MVILSSIEISKGSKITNYDIEHDFCLFVGYLLIKHAMFPKKLKSDNMARLANTL